MGQGSTEPHLSRRSLTLTAATPERRRSEHAADDVQQRTGPAERTRAQSPTRTAAATSSPEQDERRATPTGPRRVRCAPRRATSRGERPLTRAQGCTPSRRAERARCRLVRIRRSRLTSIGSWREGGRGVDEGVEQLVVARGREVEELAHGLLLGAGVLPPLALEGEDLGVAAAQPVAAAGAPSCSRGRRARPVPVLCGRPARCVPPRPTAPRSAPLSARPPSGGTAARV